MLLLVLAAGAFAADEPVDAPTPAEADPLAAEQVAARRQAVDEELAAGRESLALATDPEEKAHREAILARLGEMDGFLAEIEKHVSSPAEAGHDIPPAIKSEGGASVSVFELNELLEARHGARLAADRRAQRLEASRAALASAKEKLATAERRRREAKKELADSGGTAAERALALRRLESRAAQERVYQWVLETRLAAPDRGEETIVDVTASIDEVRAALARGTGDDDLGFAALARKEAQLRRQKEAAETQLATAELVLESARKKFARSTKSSPERLEEVEARTSIRSAIRQRIALLDARLESSARRGEVWRRWSAVTSDVVGRDEIEPWVESTAEWIEALRLQEIQIEGRIADLERRLASARARLQDLPSASAAHTARKEQIAVLDDLLDAERAEAATLAYDRRVAERLLADLEDRTGRLNASEYVSDGIDAARDIWRYEITAVDDEAITVGALLLALALAALGLWASRRGSALVGSFARRRLRVDSGASDALESIVFYVLFAGLTLFILRLVHFPLTVFTLLGGALAIGIGFGSQNVMNNFISGLILMFERPVRAGDLVEVDGHHGIIENIGGRSTRIRSTDGRHIIVPNSFFLESNVVNWTLSDELIRARVSVGVIYGSPTRLVEKLIREAVETEGRVLPRPAPILVFEDFGDNSLNFDVYFWVRARTPMAVREIQSRIRFRIDDLFREHRLVIAFPQRDVHLDSTSPLRVALVGDSDEREEEEGT